MVPFSDRARVLVVVGTRPEAIKMIPVIRALEASGRFRPVVIGTGQHQALVSELFEDAGLKLDASLNVARAWHGEKPSLNRMVARVITGIDRIWQEQRVPDDLRDRGSRSPASASACLVHGDTSSAAAAALAAFNLQIPVVHVEAGLRTSNMLAPFPEEGNRQVISRLAALHCAPTATNQMNLLQEGVDADRIVVTGNTSIDMLRWAADRPAGFGPGLESVREREDEPIVLVTAHRRENWGAGLLGIAEGVRRLAERYPRAQFVVPLHPNPVAREPLRLALEDRDNVWLVEPRDYASFAHLMRAATLVITDSGGVQEEAPALGTPVLVARDTTEREEGVEAGTLTLVGTDPERIVAETSALLEDPAALVARQALRNPYGDGHASERIVDALSQVFLSEASDEENQLRLAVRRRLGLDDGPAPVGQNAHTGQVAHAAQTAMAEPAAPATHVPEQTSGPRSSHA